MYDFLYSFILIERACFPTISHFRQVTDFAVNADFSHVSSSIQ